MKAGDTAPVLVMGFGPFGSVRDNPAERLARAVDGEVTRGRRVVGRPMTVAYAASMAESRQLVDALAPVALIGLGVATSRRSVEVERFGWVHTDAERPDVHGVLPGRLDPTGPECVEASGPVEGLARALGGQVSSDAGRYVCNGWLYQATRAFGAQLPVCFVHVPLEGLGPDHLLHALGELWPASVAEEQVRAVAEDGSR